MQTILIFHHFSVLALFLLLDSLIPPPSSDSLCSTITNRVRTTASNTSRSFYTHFKIKIGSDYERDSTAWLPLHSRRLNSVTLEVYSTL